MASINLGRVGFVPKGEYVPATTYVKYDIVSQNGSNYVAQAGSTGVTPGTDATKWKLFIDNSAAAQAATAANTAAEAATTAAEAANEAAASVPEAIATYFESLQNVSDNQIIEKTESAAFAYITDAARATAKSVDITITPVQNLNGYDHPWPAGGGKNKLPLTVDMIKAANTSDGTWSGNKFTTNGIAYSINVDANGNLQGITINGTATANSFFYLAKDYVFPDGTYILNGCPANGNADTYSQYAYTNTAYFDEGRGVIVPISSQTSNVIIRVMNGVTVSNVVFKPMFRLSSETDATFAPYSNICQITGWDEVKVGRSSKNMLPKMTAGTYTYRGVTAVVDANGVATFSGTSDNAGNFQMIIPFDGTFTIPHQGLVYQLRNSIADGNVVPTIEGETGSLPHLDYSCAPANRMVSLPDNRIGTVCSQIRFYTTKNHTVSLTFAPSLMVEAGDYEPNDGENSLQTITFPSEAGTVYGGTLHINEDGSGVLTVDRTIVDLGTLNWTSDSSRPGVKYTSSLKDVIVKDAYDSIVCSVYKTRTTGVPAASDLAANDKQISLAPSYGGGYVYIIDTDYANTTGADFKTAMSGVMMVYKLATQVTYIVTAEQVALLKGANIIYADAGDTAVEYVVDTKEYVDTATKDVSGLITTVNGMTTATASDAGKALKAKTVADGKVTEWEFGEITTIDNTLTQAGQAADAKKTGDEIGDLKSDVDEVEDFLQFEKGETTSIDGYHASNNTNAVPRDAPFVYYDDIFDYTGCLVNKIKLNVVTAGSISIGVIKKTDAVQSTSVDRTKAIVKDTVTFSETGVLEIALNHPFSVASDEYIFIGVPTDTCIWKYGPYGTNKKFLYVQATQNIWYPSDKSLGITFTVIKDVKPNSVRDLCVSVYSGKTLSILGDSISTFSGYIPEGNATYYPTGTVQAVTDTWWKKLIDALGMTLNVNNSWSGSRVTTTAGDASAGCMTRCQSLGTSPDVIIVWMGINDFNNEVALGEYDGSTAIPSMTTTFREAYGIMLNKILTAYPAAEVWVCTLPQCERNGTEGFPEINGNGVALAAFNKAIRELADAFGVKVLEHNKCGLTYQNMDVYNPDELHPNKFGHSLVANNDIWQMDGVISKRYPLS